MSLTMPQQSGHNWTAINWWGQTRRLGLFLVFVALSFLFLSDRVFPASGERHVVHQNISKLYQDPDASSPVVMELKNGDRLLEYRRQGSWIKVGVIGAVGKEGWVRALDLQPPASTSDSLDEDSANSISGSIGFSLPEAPPKPLLTGYLVKITGRPANKFILNCQYIDKNGKKKSFKKKGIVPKSYRVRAKAVKCGLHGGSQTSTRKLTISLWADGEFFGSESFAGYGGIVVYTPWDWD